MKYTYFDFFTRGGLVIFGVVRCFSPYSGAFRGLKHHATLDPIVTSLLKAQ